MSADANLGGLLEGQCGIVTGAASGIGLAIAKGFAAAGARVAVFDLSGADAAAAEIGADTLALTGDVTDPDAVAAAFAQASEHFGGLDYLINNAGIRQVASIVDQPVELWRRTIDVNLTGAFICAQAAARLMLTAGHGSIVNVASMAGILSLKDRSAYNASKAGLISLTRSLALELASRGIRCNAVAPGVIETPLSAPYFEDETMRKILTDGTPQGRWGQVADLVGPVAFLCSPAAEHVHGVTLPVDGGWITAKGY
jgi:NAD(P)-dependent dehydrogenase (short-subunit alcohol dehydrogenase family)